MPQKRLLSAFVVLNLATVAYLNMPEALAKVGREVLEELPAPLAYPFRLAGNLDVAYAYVTGQDNVWRLFEVMDHANVSFVAKARYADGALVTLPLPLQSERTFWQRHLFDFKEPKLVLYVAQMPKPRAAYSDYLCRQFPAHDGAPVTEIVWEGREQVIRPPSEAERLGTHLDSRVRTEVVARVPCGRTK
jgi:hypothetical protein